jgi:hypothetical protein
MYLRVIIKGILVDLESQTNIDYFPKPLLSFINNLCSKGSVIPD